MNKDTTVPHLPRMKAINESEYANIMQSLESKVNTLYELYHDNSYAATASHDIE